MNNTNKQQFGTFVLPYKNPNSNMQGQQQKLVQNDTTLLTDFDASYFDEDFSKGQSQKEFVSLQNKLSQLQNWIKNINEEITHDRRDLVLLQGKANTLQIHTDYEIEQFRKLTQTDCKKLQNQLDSAQETVRKNNFDLQQQLKEEQTEHLNQKKTIIGIQKKIGGLETEVGPGNLKRNRDKEQRFQELKQNKMEQTLTQHPNVSFANTNNNNTTININNKNNNSTINYSTFLK